jgi:hypothetical protein
VNTNNLNQIALVGFESVATGGGAFVPKVPHRQWDLVVSVIVGSNNNTLSKASSNLNKEEIAGTLRCYPQ